MTIKVELLDVDKIPNQILEAFVKEINTRIKRNQNNIKQATSNLILNKFKNSPTYQALTTGELKAEFGFPQGLSFSIVDPIIERISESVQIKFEPYISRGQIKGNFTIYVLRSDLSEILELVQSTLKLEDGQIIPWLEWLLLAGDQIIILGYKIQYGDGGRSGEAFMVPKPDAYWKVPPEFSGTELDNWITQTLSSQDFINDLGTIIDKNL